MTGPANNNGMATLLFCAILLGAATTLVFTLARTGLAEQRIMSNTRQHEQLRQAGNAALTFACAWLRGHTPIWQPTATGPLTTTIPLPDDNLGQAGGMALSIDGRRKAMTSAYILLTVQAWRPASDPSVTVNRYRVAMYVHDGGMDPLSHESRITPLPGTWHDFGKM
jgi:hypothetical protein